METNHLTNVRYPYESCVYCQQRNPNADEVCRYRRAYERFRNFVYGNGPLPRLADVLRALAVHGQYGHGRTVAGFYLPDPDSPAFSGSAFHALPHTLDTETNRRIARISKRYRTFHRYMTEIVPQWHEIGRTHYADNSVEATQQDKYGNTRTVMVTAPHGDAC